MLSTIAYLLNMCPTKKLKNIALEESWSGFKPNMSHLKVFCSIAYRQVLYQLRKKLEDKGKMILVGYHSSSCYKLYD